MRKTIVLILLIVALCLVAVSCEPYVTITLYPVTGMHLFSDDSQVVTSSVSVTEGITIGEALQHEESAGLSVGESLETAVSLADPSVVLFRDAAGTTQVSMSELVTKDGCRKFYVGIGTI